MNNDLLLIQEIKTRKKEALHQLYNRYESLLYRLVYSAVKDPHACESILTELFKEIWHSPDLLVKERTLSLSLCKQCIKNIKKCSQNSERISS
ncbi:DNA-directed RNA polymerase specialized sigma24 family protein [Priestia megaterium]|uniref:RNA polymerase sigma factor n=1 Tax=Priestia megaterium TaxID=1404 RepID=UPI0033913A30